MPSLKLYYVFFLIRSGEFFRLLIQLEPFFLIGDLILKLL